MAVLEEAEMVKKETGMIGGGFTDIGNFLQDIVQDVLLFGPEV